MIRTTRRIGALAALGLASGLLAASYENFEHGFRLEIPSAWKRGDDGGPGGLRLAAPGGLRARLVASVRGGGVDMAACLRARDGDVARLSRRYKGVTPLGPPAVDGWVGNLQAWTWGLQLQSAKGAPLVYRAWLVQGPDGTGGRDLVLKAAVLARPEAWARHRTTWEATLGALVWPVPMPTGPDASDLVFAELFPEGTPDWIERSRLDGAAAARPQNPAP